MQLGQTAVTSKILATTTAVYYKTKAYNILTSRKISLRILKLCKLCQSCTYDGHILGNFLGKLGKYTPLIGPLNFPFPKNCIKKGGLYFFYHNDVIGLGVLCFTQ